MTSHPELGDGASWLIVGQVSKPHGVHGSFLAQIITDFPERVAVGVRLGLGPAEGPESSFEVHAVRLHQGRWLMGAEGVRDRDTVEGWRGLYLFLPEQALDELPEGYFYEHHLVGLECRDASGTSLGTITGLDHGVGQVRAVVRRGRREYLVPWVPEIVIEVDVDGGTVILDPPAGLLDDDAELA